MPGACADNFPSLSPRVEGKVGSGNDTISSPRYLCPAERENGTTARAPGFWPMKFRAEKLCRGLRFPVPQDKGNVGSGDEIACALVTN